MMEEDWLAVLMSTILLIMVPLCTLLLYSLLMMGHLKNISRSKCESIVTCLCVSKVRIKICCVFHVHVVEKGFNF